MSRKIIETFWSWYNAGIDRTEIRALIECDTLTDLPSQDALSGYRLTIGTTAHVIDTNAVYMMQSGGAWKVQSAGTDVYTKAETDALIQGSKDYADGLIDALDVASVGGTTRYIYQISETNGKISASSYASDTTPTAGSTKLVQSGGIKLYVDTQVSTKASISDVFGVGSNEYIPDSADMNTYTQAGVYIRQFSSGLADFTNLPMDGTTYPYQPFKLIVEFLNSPNNIMQTIIPTYSACGFFKRCRIFGASGTWQAWQFFGGTPV